MKTVYRIVLTDEYIEEAQRLIIAQNRTLRFLYQTWWVWWLPRVAITGCIVFLLTAGLALDAMALGAFLLLTFFGELYSRRSLAKARNRTRAKGSTTTVTIDENGIDIVGALGSSHLKWAALLSPTLTPGGVLLRVSRVGGTWLPDRALVEGSAADVRRLLAANSKLA